MDQKTYTGYRQPGVGETADRAEVVVGMGGGDPQPLDPRFDLRRHADAFNWGYGGAGPAQLALALAADVLGDDDRAREVYQALKVRLVARLPRDGWALTEGQVREVLARIEEEKGRASGR